MRDKVILGVTLSIVLLLTLIIYGVIDTQRGPTVSAARLEEDALKGKHLFAQYCIQCHGPLGEGCIGPALNRQSWRPTLENGAPNADYDAATHDFIKRTLVRGRAANQPGINMPAWSIAEGGPLNDAELEQLVTFVQYGDWGRVLEDAASAAGLGENLPSYNGFPDAQLPHVKQLMLEKGCLNCHQLGKVGGAVGAVLSDVGSRRDAQWLHDWIRNPSAMPATKRGPNLWLVAATATVPLPGGSPPQATGAAPGATAVAYPMNKTYMPTIPMTEDQLNLLVQYLSHARTTSK